MKKRILIPIFLPLILIALFIPNIVSMNTQTVSLISLEEFTKENIITTTGKIEQINKNDIKTDIPIVTENVLVDVGDTVKVDQVIATVDVEKTKETLMSVSTMSEYIPTEVISVLSEFDYDKVESLIPTQIKSSYDGVVTNISATTGELLYPDQVIATISNLDSNIRAKIDIPESVVENVQAGQEVTITPMSNEDLKIKGTVSLVFPTAYDTLNQTAKETVVSAYVDIDDTQNLKAGYNITADIKYDDDEICKGVPYSAINQDEDNNEYVYVIKGNKAVKTIVEVGYESKNLAQIVSGVDENDLIVENCSDIKKDGQIIKTN